LASSFGAFKQAITEVERCYLDIQFILSAKGAGKTA
jgi:hypothetical protein